MKITVNVNRKVGRPNYGSEGASCELTLDVAETSVAENPAALVDEIRRAYALAEQAVTEQLATVTAEHDPELVPDRDQFPARNVNGNGRAYAANHGQRDEAAANTSRRAVADQRTARASGNGRDYGEPRDGRQCYSWAKRQREETGRDVLGEVSRIGENLRLPQRMTEWNEKETREALAVWRSNTSRN